MLESLKVLVKDSKVGHYFPKSFTDMSQIKKIKKIKKIATSILNKRFEGKSNSQDLRGAVIAYKPKKI